MASIELDLIPSNIDPSFSESFDLIKGVVTKPIERLNYSTYYDDKSVGISYFESEELNSDDNLQVVDESWSIEENDRRRFDDSNYITFNSRSYFTEYKDVVITNIVGSDLHNREIPLFYKHKVSIGKKIYNIDEIVVISNERKDTIKYGYSLKKGMLYTNYKNVYDPKTLEYRVYFVNGSYTDGTTFNEILNVESAIVELNWENYNDENVSKYTREEQTDGFLYTVEVSDTLAAAICANNKSMNYYLKPLKGNSLYIKKPSIKYIDNEWLVEITNGYLYKTINGNAYKYTVPEYQNQSFNIEKPLIRLDDKECFLVTNKIVKLPYNEIKFDVSKELTLEVYYYDNENNRRDLNIKSVDEAYGFVELEESLPKNTEVVIKASFYYNAKSLYYQDINFNPYQNKDIIDSKFIFYILPNQQEKSIYHIEVPKEGNFIDSFNPRAQSLASLETYLENKKEDLNILILGEVYFKDTTKLKNCFEFDIRKSNILIEENLKNIFKRNPQLLQSKFGYGPEGQRIPKENIVFLDLPIELKESGDYTEDQLLNLFKRFLKASTNLIINYVYKESKIRFESYKAGETILKLSFEGAGEYKLLKKIDGVFKVIKTWNIEDSDSYGLLVTDYELTYIDEDTKLSTRYEYLTVLDNRKSKRLYKVVPHA